MSATKKKRCVVSRRVRAGITRELQAMLGRMMAQYPPPLPVSMRVGSKDRIGCWGYTRRHGKKYFEVCIGLDSDECEMCAADELCACIAERMCAHRASAHDTLIHEYAHVLSWDRDRHGADIEWGIWYARLYFAIRGPH